MFVATRTRCWSDGLHKPSWGPLTYDGIKGMHYGDFFYAAFGLMVYYVSWPEASAAREWPALDAHVLSSWVALVLARNLALEISFYEFWHQLLFGVLANEAVTKHRYSEGSPYEPKPGQKSAQMSERWPSEPGPRSVGRTFSSSQDLASGFWSIACMC